MEDMLEQKITHLYVFIAPPGAGKGSLAQLCNKKMRWKQFSTGDLCRRHIAEKTQIGKEMDLLIKSGKLIPDSIIMDMAKDELLAQHRQNEQHVVLDGFPRTFFQAQEFDFFISTHQHMFDITVFRFYLPDEVIIQRLSNRIICSKCNTVYSTVHAGLASKKESVCDHCDAQLTMREDDCPEVIKKRLATYYLHEKKLLDFYKDKDLLASEINTDQRIEKVFENFQVALDKK